METVDIHKVKHGDIYFDHDRDRIMLAFNSADHSGLSTLVINTENGVDALHMAPHQRASCGPVAYVLCNIKEIADILKPFMKEM